MSNDCFSIWTKDKEYKIYCGKKLREYHNKLAWLSRKWDLRPNPNYSGAAKKCILETFKSYIKENFDKSFREYFYKKHEDDLDEVFRIISQELKDFPKSNNGITLRCIDLWCDKLGYTISNSEKNRRQNREIKKLLNELNKELGFKRHPRKKHYDYIREWINEKGHLFRKYIGPNVSGSNSQILSCNPENFFSDISGSNFQKKIKQNLRGEIK